MNELTDNPARAGEPSFRGSKGSALDNMVAKVEQLRTRANALILTAENADIRIQLAKAEQELEKLRSEIQGKFAKIKDDRDIHLRDAEDTARLTHKRILDQERAAQRAYEEAEKAFNQAQASASGVEQQTKRRSQQLEDLGKTLDQAEKEADEKSKALADLSARTENPQKKVDDLRGKRDAAKRHLEIAKYDLRVRRAELPPLEAQLAGVYDGVVLGYREGVQLFKQAGAANKAKNQDGCVSALRQSRARLTAATGLANLNRSCLEADGKDVRRAISRINALLSRIEANPCSGGTPLDEDLTVPDVRGRQLSEAMSILRAAGFAASRGVAYQPTVLADAGDVRDQAPAANSPQPAGTTVVLSYFNEAVKIPDVRGRSIEAAETILAGKGLFGNPIAGEPNGDLDMARIVYEQSPPGHPDSRVMSRSNVNLTYYVSPLDAGADRAPDDPDATGADDPTSDSGGADAGASDLDPSGGTGEDESSGLPADTDESDPTELSALEPGPEVDSDAFYVDPEPLLGEDQSFGSAPPSGWERAGELETISGEPAGNTPAPGAESAAAPPEADKTLPPAPADPPDYLAGQAEAAALACDYSSALSWARDLQRDAPGHPWVSSRLPAIQDEARRYAAARQAFDQARSAIGGSAPSEAAAQRAIALARRAQTIAPDCMSEQVAGLNGPIDQLSAAIRDRNRTSFSQGLSSLLQGVTMAASSVAASRSGYAPPSVPNTATGGTAGDLAGALGALSAARGAGAGGVASLGGLGASASSGDAAQCDTCMVVDRGGFSSVADVFYVFETTIIGRNVPQCGGQARLRYYESLPISGDDQEQQEGAAFYIRAASVAGRSVRKLCGPCGSAARAASLMRSRCPNPSHNINQGLGGTTINGSPIGR